MSCSALADLSVIEKNQIPINATSIENNAGCVYGNIAVSNLKISTHTVLLNTTKTIAVIRPKNPPINAPLVVNFDQ